jgi:hypothetical protein
MEPETAWPGYEDIPIDPDKVEQQVEYYAHMYQNQQIDAASAVAGLKSIL